MYLDETSSSLLRPCTLIGVEALQLGLLEQCSQPPLPLPATTRCLLPLGVWTAQPGPEFSSGKWCDSGKWLWGWWLGPCRCAGGWLPSHRWIKCANSSWWPSWVSHLAHIPQRSSPSAITGVSLPLIFNTDQWQCYLFALCKEWTRVQSASWHQAGVGGMCIKCFIARGTDKIYCVEHARCTGFIICDKISCSWRTRKESALDLPEIHHPASIVFFLSSKKVFGEHYAAAARNRA